KRKQTNVSAIILSEDSPIKVKNSKTAAVSIKTKPVEKKKTIRNRKFIYQLSFYYGALVKSRINNFLTGNNKNG
ncbi:hypothetical protein, partial [uncultured Winogradskyella sp.]|uniref:hypothetical protein n=1 Tax=uncultured Winogradskyella sp. TaxID=395353 RepID=UPI0030EE1A0C